jgi:hypothetical protein
LNRPCTWGVLLLFSMCFYVYAINFMTTGNPMYPLTLRIAGVEIFQGSLRPIEDIVMGHSTFGSVSEMKFARRWHAVFSDWFQPVNQDAFGGAGPIFSLATIFAAFLGIGHSIKNPAPWIVAVTLTLTVMLIIPAAHLPRYSLAWLCLIAICASVAYSKIETTLPIVCTVILIMLIPGMYIQARGIQQTFAWAKQMSYPQSLHENRGRSIVEKVDIDRTLAPTGAMVQAIRDNVKSGQLMIFSVRSHASLMWNREYSNNIKYLKHQDDITSPPNKLSQISRTGWLETVQHQAPQWILIYAKSGLVEALQNLPENERYTLEYEDKESGDETADRWNMVLLRK